jgi:hypothetical protein
LNHLTGALLPADKAGCAPWCFPPQARANAVSGQKSPALRVAESSPSAALRRLLDAPHRASRRALPNELLSDIKWFKVIDRCSNVA